MPMTYAWMSMMLALPPLMPLEAIEHGQRGECLTVFEGEQVEAFPFVVKGVMNDHLGPGEDLVLIRLEGDKAEFTGVVAGMSGSPCSIGGKLVGALSYAFASFAKEPIAGVTPMRSMLDVMKLPPEPMPWRLSQASEKSAWQALARGDAPGDPSRGQGGPGDFAMRPITTPLTLSGVAPAVAKHFGPWLRSLGFEPVAGGSASGGASKNQPLVPGSAVCAVLVRGDVDIAATGTVTSVEGDEVLAFGHPFFGAGAVSIPMASASIINTMASQMRSFKMSLTGPVIGEVTQDRLSAIGGYLGRHVRMIPVMGKVTTPNTSHDFAFEVVRDLAISPRFIAMGLANALAGRIDASDRGTVRLTAQITSKEFEPLVFRNVYSAQRDGGLMIGAAIDISQAVSILWRTPFGPPPDISIDLQAVYEPQPIEEWIDSVYIDRALARPGDAFRVGAVLRREDGPTSTESFLLTVPPAWAGKTVKIVLAGAGNAQRLADQIYGFPEPTKLQHVARWLSGWRSDGHVYVMAVADGVSLSSQGLAIDRLPPSVAAMVAHGPEHLARGQAVVWEERRARPGTVAGERSVTLKIQSF